MGERGPKGKPTNLRVLHGDRKDRINTDEPQPPDGLPELPDDASDEVREIWDYTLGVLEPMKLASPADRDALICYCEAVATHRRCSRILAKSNVLIQPRGRGSQQPALVRNPVVAMQRDAALTIRAFAREFGLTPSARSDIHMNGRRGGSGADPGRLLS